MIDAMGGLPLGAWALFAQSTGSFWMPGEHSTFAPEVDRVFYFILAVCAFFFLVVLGLMIFFVLRYRRRPGVKPGKTATHSTPLEVGWTLALVAIVAVIFYKGFTAFMEMETPPQGCYEIRVTGRQWAWQFTYANGHVDDVLHVPVDQPVKLTMTSQDVIHSLSIPDFRVKMDLVPGRYTSTWFKAVNPGEYPLYCTEYCGDKHSQMITAVVVHSPGEFAEWLKGANDYLENLSPAEAGKLLYTKRGCVQCHTIDGSANPNTPAPSFKGIYGETHDLVGGATVVVDDNYIRESILEPGKKVRAGYRPIMNTYQGLVSDQEIVALIEFIKSLK
ncbi:MAG: cytochrome c oxidase subunit II [Pirellulales bacterium]|nr:cytochrome c oxidase subunit II [Pirellulales bacterium]